MIDTAVEAEIARVRLFDPTPAAVRAGRRHLYGTDETSGLGHVSCASCHADARMDRLAWDLGNPQGDIKAVDPAKHNLGLGLQGLSQGFEDFHPMKGPMTTQTLQDIIGKEPHHWRGDRDGLEEFNGAFQGLLGDDEQLTAEEMQEFEDIPPGPNGEHHLALVSIDGSTNVTMKVPQLRNLYDKVGFEATQSSNQAGFGFLHDGSVDSIARFVSEPVFTVAGDQEVADLVAFMLAFSGSDLPEGSRNPNAGQPPGVDSQDTHAAVGVQVTVASANRGDAQVIALLELLTSLADGGAVGLTAKGLQGGLQRGWEYLGGGILQSDRASETTTVTALREAAGDGAEVTFTVVADGTQRRIGIDRDEDGFFDRDELDACTDPADPASTPLNAACLRNASGPPLMSSRR